jgi:hypothetical protein
MVSQGKCVDTSGFGAAFHHNFQVMEDSGRNVRNGPTRHMRHGGSRLSDEVKPAVGDRASWAAVDAAQEAVPNVVVSVLVTGSARSRINAQGSTSFTKHLVARHSCHGRFCLVFIGSSMRPNL